VAVANMLPLVGEGGNNDIIPEGGETNAVRVIADIRTVNPGYFRTLGIPTREGRSVADTDGERRVAVVSALTAARLWPGQSAVGKRLRIGTVRTPLIEVVGVVGDVRGTSLDRTPGYVVYQPYWQRRFNRNRQSFAVRATGDPRALARSLTAAIHEVDGALAVPPFQTMNDRIGESTSVRRFLTTLVSVFGVAALCLGSIGLYGVMSYSVAQRAREIAVRIALGARQDAVVRSVLREALGLTAIGLTLGIPAALAAAAAVRALLFGVEPTTSGSSQSSVRWLCLERCSRRGRQHVEPSGSIRS
jgi:hypothetical protein